MIKKHYDALIFCGRISLEASTFFSALRGLLEIIMACLPLLSTRISRSIMNNLAYGTQDDMRETFVFVLASFFLVLLNSAMAVFKNFITQCHNDRIEFLINQKKLYKSATIDLKYFDSSNYYNEYAIASQNSAAASATVWNLYSFLGTIFKIIALIVLFFQYSPFLPLLLIICGTPLAVIEDRHKKQILQLQKDLMPLNRRLGYITNIFTTRSFAIDVRVNNYSSYVFDKYGENWEERFRATKELTKKHSWRSFLFSNLPQIIIVATTIYLASLVSKGNMLIGDYTYILGIAQQLLSAIIAGVGLATIYFDNINRTVDFVNFLNTDSSFSDDGELLLDPSAPHTISFKKVGFRYPGTERWILRNVSLDFSTNDIVALVGENGSGKSTIVKLLLRLYDVCEGSIDIDGVSISEYNLTSIRNFFGVMPQNHNNYSFTLRENIALSSIENAMDESRMIDAIQSANALSVYEKIGSLDAYLTRMFDENGVELSGGEWQKIAVARSFFKKAKMLIFDEPSSSMDAKSEYELFKNIFDDSKKCGALLISHRLANTKRADRIFVLKNGMVEEYGTHEELINQNGLYAEMFNLQQQRYQ